MEDFMHQLPPLVTTIAVAFTAAWLLGLITQRLGLSPIVGYLIAGVLIGPKTPGFVGDVKLAPQLAEIGVILLMFGVGLHFHLKDLLAVRSVAIPGAIGQSAIATILGVVVFSAFGVPATSGAILGMAMAVASTVVLMRVLMDANALQSPEGHVAVGWLLVEDVLTVAVLVLIPVLGNEGPQGATSHTELPLWVAIPFTVFWLTGMMNTINWLDGLSGLVAASRKDRLRLPRVAQGAFAPLPTDVAAQAMVGMATQILSWWTEHPSISIQALQDTMTTIALHGLLPAVPDEKGVE
jgi:predicted Kef-type K+ transport protein